MHATTRSSEAPDVPCGDVPHCSSQLKVSWSFQVFIVILNRRLCANVYKLKHLSPLVIVTLTRLAVPNQLLVPQALRRLRCPRLRSRCDPSVS
jgi:hypothetical protein